jgi:acyl-CoA synthetase (AMP-forming)/AMP-acid ligase II
MANIARYFFKRAKSHPQALALSFEGRTQTYAELAQRVTQLAGGLRLRLALQPGERIVLCMENRPEFVELLLACWCAGLCAVPVNSKLHPKEIAHIADDSGARAVFTSEALYAAMADIVAVPASGATHASSPRPTPTISSYGQIPCPALTLQPMSLPGFFTPVAPPVSPKGRCSRTATSWP